MAVTAPGDKVSKPERIRRVLIVFTTAFTFAAGVFAAQGHATIFVAMLVFVAVMWIVAAIAHA